MANNREPDMGQMWRQQPQERSAMTLEEIKTRAGAFEHTVKQWRLVGGLTVALLVVKNAWEVWIDTDVIERAGDLLLLLALLYVVYRFFSHVRASAPAVLGRTTCREHYRAQLVRQRELSRDGWKYILPFAPGFGLIIVGRAFEGRPASQVAMLIGIALAIFAGVLWVIARSGRRLEREIAALD
jgi:hypothetical protein